MSGRWEPGTVAVATVRGVPNVRVFRRYDDWTSADLAGGWIGHNDRLVTDVRPLVVLDLADLGPRGIDYSLLMRTAATDDDAEGRTGRACILRNLADQIEAQTRPPKPAEPTGLGAVVRDDEGDTLVRVGHGGPQAEGFGPWWSTNDTRRYQWDELLHVEVLSEGVA